MLFEISECLSESFYLFSGCLYIPVFVDPFILSGLLPVFMSRFCKSCVLFWASPSQCLLFCLLFIFCILFFKCISDFLAFDLSFVFSLTSPLPLDFVPRIF